MSKVSARLTCALLFLSLMAQGCGGQKSVPVKDRETPAVTTGTPPVNPLAAEKEDVQSSEAKPVASPQTPVTVESGSKKESSSPVTLTPTVDTPAAEQKPRADVRPFSEAGYLPNDVVGLLVVHPKSYFETPMGKLLIELGLETESGTPSELLSGLGLKLADMERVTVVIDQSLVTTFARRSGLPVANLAAAGAPQGDFELKDALKQIGLAFHNYHDVYQSFPRVDGDGPGEKTGLSWRVHLLPYFGQADLYNQFHLDEAWDSEHNKELIALMPELFRSPGVTDEGKTSFHVISGENTMFQGETGTRLAQITDGTSNTILAVLAGADKADFWTKPSGLEVDLTSPWKGLGEVPDEGAFVLFADGSVKKLPKGIEDSALAKMIQPTDGQVVDMMAVESISQKDAMIPPMILTLSRDVAQAELVTSMLIESKEETHESQTFSRNKTMAVWFADSRTVVSGPIHSVKQMITTKQTGKTSASPLIAELNLAASLTLAVDLESQAEIIRMLVQINPMMGMVANIKTLGVQFSGTGEVADPMFAIDVTALDAGMAGGLFAVASMGLNQGKTGVAQLTLAPNASESDKAMMAFVKQLVASSTLEQHEDKIHFRVPVPKNFDRMPDIMKPSLLSGRNTARLAAQMNTLRQIGLGFHNHHSVYNSLPGAGKASRDKPVGLSWRVALLPFLEQEALYKEFKQDEPWDSDHNKTLIEKMPAIFKSPGVDEPGKTSIHVFVGPGAPFAADATPNFDDFTDGMFNTIVAVLAGPDTAETWTKPGGLDFDPKDPVKSLGELGGDTVITLMADGTVTTISKKIDPEQLRRSIQIADAEPIQ